MSCFLFRIVGVDNFVLGPVGSPHSGPPSAVTTSVVTPRSHQKRLGDGILTKERNLVRKIPRQILLFCSTFWHLMLRRCSDGKITRFLNVCIPHGTVLLPYSSPLCIFLSRRLRCYVSNAAASIPAKLRIIFLITKVKCAICEFFCFRKASCHYIKSCTDRRFLILFVSSGCCINGTVCTAEHPFLHSDDQTSSLCFIFFRFDRITW
jgi:hypothetical protein